METLQKDQSDWAKKTVEVLSKASPTSLKVSFSQYHRGSKMSLPECLKMEYRMVQNFMNNDDFFEGVRARKFHKNKTKSQMISLPLIKKNN